jgi:hypothetical protein
MNKRKEEMIVELQSTGSIPLHIMRRLLRAMRFMFDRAWGFLRKKKAIIIEDSGFQASIKANLAHKRTRRDMKFAVVVTTCHPWQNIRMRAAKFRTIKAVFAVRPPSAFMAYN